MLWASLSQTPNRGNGGTDILLIKIDAFGNHEQENAMKAKKSLLRSAK